MSRIGNNPITLPDGVEISIDGASVTVKGPKGTLEHALSDKITAGVDDGTVTLVRADDERETKALHGLNRALVANMVEGVSQGFRKDLSLVGVGYRAALKGKSIELQVGFSHPIVIDAVEGVEFEVPEPTRIVVSGIDKGKVGQMAANIRRVRPPEPYKGKGIRYADEVVRKKAGKAGV
jgi:large subunit ribosomal protein L6